MRAIITKITVVCLTGLVAVSALGSGMILCLGENGHVAVESPGNTECCSHEGDTHGKCADEHDDTSCISSGEDTCRGCIDIPIPELQRAEFAVETQLSLTLHQALAVCSEYCLSNAVVPIDCMTSPPLAGSHLTAPPNMTVVLRI